VAAILHCFSSYFGGGGGRSSSRGGKGQGHDDDDSGYWKQDVAMGCAGEALQGGRYGAAAFKEEETRRRGIDARPQTICAGGWSARQRPCASTNRLSAGGCPPASIET
jgi:hypothetical protein